MDGEAVSICVSVDLMCDICGYWDDTETVTGSIARKAVARRRAKAKGWTRRLDGDVLIDVCPNHGDPEVGDTAWIIRGEE